MALVIFSCFILYCFISGFIYLFFPRHYKGIKFTTKNITYIALLSAASVTLTVLITYFAPVTVLPTIRISFEGLMIKITGLIFGPIVGVFSGLITDMLCILFIPSYFHIAYTFTVVFYGFMAGISYSFSKKIKKSFLLYLISSIFVIIFMIFFTFFVQYFPMSEYSGVVHRETTEAISHWTLSIIVILSGVGVFAFQTIVYIWYLIYNNRANKKNIEEKKRILNIDIFTIITLNVLTEFYLTATILPWGDASLFGQKSFAVLVIYHIAEAPVKIFFNTIIIYITFRTVAPLVNKDD